MALSKEFVDQHIQCWTAKLQSPRNLPYRTKWPQYLFRHEPVENVAKILSAGNLLSRHAARDLHDTDVGAPNVLSTNDSAHSSVRLYFRPRNPTQYSIEGIRKRAEYFDQNPATHAPILVMLIFDSASVLTASGVQFSDGNMQSVNTQVGTTENFFQTIPFEDVYHDTSFTPNNKNQIIRARCAEVLVPSPMSVRDKLKGVVCRSNAERATLLHLLGAHSKQWQGKIKIFESPGLFFNKWAYVNSVDAEGSGITFSLHPREDSLSIEVGLTISDSINRKTIYSNKWSLDGSKRYKVNQVLAPGVYKVAIEIDGCLAYCSDMLVDDLPF